jgi:CelD/BcsL family acetyltransferase involved in cellulose biosynthesis
VVVERIETLDSLRRLRPEWDRLASSHRAGLPFHRCDWALAWWSHFSECRLAVRDDLVAFAARDTSGQLVGLAPLMITRRPGIAAAFRVIDAFGADPNVTELRGAICDPAHEASMYTAILGDLDARAAAWDWVHLRGVRADSEAACALAGRAGVEWTRETPGYVLPLGTTWEEVRARLPRNVKEAIRRCYNSLRREGLRFELAIAETPAQVAGALEIFFELHRARAELTGTVRHPDVFRSEVARAFLRDACDRFARAGAMRVFQIRIGGAVVAMRLGFAIDDTLYLYYSGCDPWYGRYSVMTTMVVEAIRAAIEERLARVHLSFGTDVSKTRWAPLETVFRDAVYVSSTLRARLAHLAHDCLSQVVACGPAASVVRRVMGRRATAGDDADRST